MGIVHIGHSEYQYQYQYSTDSPPLQNVGIVHIGYSEYQYQYSTLQNVVIVQGVWKSFQPEYKPGKLLQDLNPF